MQKPFLSRFLILRLRVQAPDKKASILIVTLWAVAVLTILSVALAHFIFQQIKVANFMMRSSVSLPLAKAAYQRLFLEWQEDLPEDYDSYVELAEEQKQELCDGIEYKYYFADKKLVEEEEVIIDESALININLVSSRVLERLPGLDEDLAKEIVESGKRPFKMKEEILLIKGIDKEKFHQFKDLITVYGTGRININTVSAGVLSALGLEDELIEKIMQYRQNYVGDDGEEGTEDDGTFTNPSTIASDLGRYTDLSTQEQQDLIALMNTFSVNSEYLRLNVIPQVKGKHGIHYSILIHPGTQKIISWNEY